MTIRFIGDVHGKFNAYKSILKDSPHPTIQVGDMGVGFRKTDPHLYGEDSANPPYDLMVEGNHRFIRGNHDNPEVCLNHSQCIKDGTFDDHEGKSVMYIGGAFSIDWEWRTKGYSWWEDEELSTDELNDLVGDYVSYKPEVMVTHTCPIEVSDLILKDLTNPGMSTWRLPPSRTEYAFQEMFEAHKPDTWIFGHWHHNFDQEIRGTRFICLNELCTLDYEV